MRETPARAARLRRDVPRRAAATAGCVGAVSFKRAGGTVDIHRLVVDPAAFRGGVATALLDALEAREARRDALDGRHRRRQRARPRALRAARLPRHRGAGRARRHPLGAPGPRGRDPAVPLDFAARDRDPRPAAGARPPARARRRAAGARRPGPPGRAARARLPRARRALAARPVDADLRPVGVDHLGPRGRCTSTSSTTDGPSWKPLPILFTAPFSLRRRRRRRRSCGSLVARAGGLLAIAMAYRLAARLAGPVAGAIAGRRAAAGRRVHPQLRARQLGGPARRVLPAGARAPPRRAPARRVPARLPRRAAAPRGVAAVGPLRALAASRSSGAGGRRGARSRSSAAPGVLTLVVWFVPEYLGSGSLLRAAERARQPNPDSAAFAASPFLEVFRALGVDPARCPSTSGARDRRACWPRGGAGRAVRAGWWRRSRCSRPR